MRRILGIVLSIAILGSLGFFVYLDLSEHGVAELLHYVVHILVCVMFCSLLHNPVHRFIAWVKSLLGFKPDAHDHH